MSNVDLGHNLPPVDHGAMVTDRLSQDYAESLLKTASLLTLARSQPARINDDDDEAATAMGKVVRDMREHTDRLEAFRVAEKQPYKASADAVDQLFFENIEKLMRRNNKQKPGAADILQARINDFLERKRLAAIKRQEEERKAAEEKARLQRLAEEQARKEAEEAEAKAARARKTENIEAARAAAEEAQAKADALHMAARENEQRALDAAAAQTAKAADVVRTRGGNGIMLTMAETKFARVTDYTLVPLEALRPYLKPSAIDDAVKAWGKATEHKMTMPGVEVGIDRAGVTR